MSYAFATPHPFRALSKRKPDVCALCLKSITDALHQPDIPGLEELVPEDKAPSQIKDAQPVLF